MLVYLVSSLALTYLSFQMANQYYQNAGVAFFIDNKYFMWLSLAYVFSALYFCFHGTSTIISDDKSILNRLNISSKKVKRTAFFYHFLILILIFSSIMITSYLMIELYLAHYPYAFYNKALVFNIIANKSFLSKIMPFFTSYVYLAIFVTYGILVSGAIRIYSKYDSHSYIDVFLALFASFMIIMF